MVLFSSPLFDVYAKHQRRIHDFFVELLLLLMVFLADNELVRRGYNVPTLSLFFFAAGYSLTYVLIRLAGKKHLFSLFSEHGVAYILFFSWWAWLAYLVLVRIQRFPTHFWQIVPFVK